MTSATIDPAGVVRLHRVDHEAVAFPFLWLRDNCPSGFHPSTEERTFDLLSVPDDIAPGSAEIVDDALVLDWNGSGHVSRYPLSWLWAHQPGRPMADAADVSPASWRGGTAPFDMPRGKADDLLTSDAALLDWLVAGKRTGIALVDGIADDPGAGMDIARRVGFLRETNFGTTFDVVSKPDPNNLAYTANALPLHTDLPNQEMPPGFQFLHCLANEAQGGGSVFCDGFAIAEDLRSEDPPSFETLAGTEIPLRFHDRDYDIRSHEPVIGVRRDGRLEQIRFNAHIAGVFDMPAEHQAGYYRAYRRFMAATRNTDYHLTLP